VNKHTTIAITLFVLVVPQTLALLCWSFFYLMFAIMNVSIFSDSPPAVDLAQRLPLIILGGLVICWLIACIISATFTGRKEMQMTNVEPFNKFNIVVLIANILTTFGLILTLMFPI